MKLSIIVPVYNVEKYLERCIDSLLEQGLPAEDYEILLVDDDSPDGSKVIAQRYEAKYSQIKYFHKENAGLGAARNYGLQRAQGDYILFVDSDDWLSANALAKLLNQVESENLEVLIFNIQRIFDNGKTISSEIQYLPDYVYSGKEFLLKERLVVSPCINIFKRALLLEKGIFFREGVFYEDIDFYLLVLLHAQRIMYVPEVVYQYYANEESITMNKTVLHQQKRVIDYGKAILEIYHLEEAQRDEMRERIAYIRERYCRFWLQMFYRTELDFRVLKPLIFSLKQAGAFPIEIKQYQLDIGEQTQFFYFNRLMFVSQFLFDKRFSITVWLMKINKRFKILS